MISINSIQNILDPDHNFYIDPVRLCFVNYRYPTTLVLEFASKKHKNLQSVVCSYLLIPDKPVMQNIASIFMLIMGEIFDDISPIAKQITQIEAKATIDEESDNRKSISETLTHESKNVFIEYTITSLTVRVKYPLASIVKFF